MWGAGFLNSGHFEHAGSGLIIDFVRRYIGLLPEDVQEKFAYRNAQRVFGGYLDLSSPGRGDGSVWLQVFMSLGYRWWHGAIRVPAPDNARAPP